MCTLRENTMGFVFVGWSGSKYRTIEWGESSRLRSSATNNDIALRTHGWQSLVPTFSLKANNNIVFDTEPSSSSNNNERGFDHMVFGYHFTTTYMCFHRPIFPCIKGVHAARYSTPAHKQIKLGHAFIAPLHRHERVFIVESGGTTHIGLWLFELGNELIAAYKKKMVNTRTHTRVVNTCR